MSRFLLLTIAVAFAFCSFAEDKPAAGERLSTKPAKKNPERHEKFLEIAKKGGVDVLFLGDSITDGWNGQKKIWGEKFAPLKAANFGIGGDRTEHVLWRLQNGELEGIQPKVIQIMIGTNNSVRDTAEDIAAGIKAIIDEIQKRSPKSKILLLAVFPRSAQPDAKREKLAKVNGIIAKFDNGTTIKYLDIGDKFLEPDKSISKEIMPDFLHLSEKGYKIWADAVEPVIKEMMK